MKVDLNDYYSLGYVKKTVNRNGEIIVFLDVDDPTSYNKLRCFFVEMPSGLVPFFIEKIQFRHNGEAAVKLEGVQDEAKAEMLKGKSLWLPVEQLPKLTGNRFYYHEVVNWHIFDENNTDIGAIKDILDNSVQPLFQIIHPSGKEVLIPIHDDILKKIDRDNQRIEVVVPEGLVELYLS
jgi:16S rRNA processing protein RimM